MLINSELVIMSAPFTAPQAKSSKGYRVTPIQVKLNWIVRLAHMYAHMWTVRSLPVAMERRPFKT